MGHGTSFRKSSGAVCLIGLAGQCPEQPPRGRHRRFGRIGILQYGSKPLAELREVLFGIHRGVGVAIRPA